MDVEGFLEVRLYPFLYDKTLPNYKDKEEKRKRWDLIGALLGLTVSLHEEPPIVLVGQVSPVLRFHCLFQTGNHVF
ncbi:hypothetical protein MTO96_044779 [Rhipicephalus appendiculatus]